MILGDIRFWFGVVVGVAALWAWQHYGPPSQQQKAG